MTIANNILRQVFGNYGSASVHKSDIVSAVGGFHAAISADVKGLLTVSGNNISDSSGLASGHYAAIMINNANEASITGNSADVPFGTLLQIGGGAIPSDANNITTLFCSGNNLTSRSSGTALSLQGVHSGFVVANRFRVNGGRPLFTCWTETAKICNNWFEGWDTARLDLGHTANILIRDNNGWSVDTHNRVLTDRGDAATQDPNSGLAIHGSFILDYGDLICQMFNVSSNPSSFVPYGLHIIDSSQTGITGPLVDGVRKGQRVKFVCKKAGHDIDIIVSHHVMGSPRRIRLSAAGEWVELVWEGGDWVETGGSGQRYP